MESGQIKKFLSAVESSKSKRFTASTDLGTHFHNDDRSIVIYDESIEMLYNISKPHASVLDNIVQIRGSNITDIHELCFIGSVEDVKEFAKNVGLKLTEEQDKILLNIKASNYNLKPVTGDYSSFVKLTEEELSKLSQEEKEKYEEQLKNFENSSNNFAKSPVQVTI